MKPHPKNWTVHPLKQKVALAEALEQFGWLLPVVWNRRTGRILDGHARVNEAISQEWPAVPVRVVDVDEETEDRILSSINRIALLAETDEDRLHQLLTELAVTESGLSPGWEETDLTDLTELLTKEIEDVVIEGPGDGPAVEEEDEDDDEVSVEEAPPRVAPGDVWRLGAHLLLCGDCRDGVPLKHFLGGAKIDLAFTSPPYASQREYDSNTTFKPIPETEYLAWYDDVQRQLAIHLSDTGSYFLNIKEHSRDGQRSLYVKELVLRHATLWGWRFVDEFAWTHQGYPGDLQGRFKNQFEPIFHFTLSPKHKFRPDAVSHEQQDLDRTDTYSGRGVETPCTSGSPFSIDRKRSYSGLARPGNVLRINKGATAKDTGAKHEAVFPWQLPQFFVKAFTDPGDVVFDPFLGSGSTLIACEKEGRVCYGTELSPRYCDTILTRWERITGLTAVKL